MQIKRVLETIASYQLTLAAIGVLGVLVAICVDVFCRAVFNAPISATLDIVSFWCMIPVAFFPMMFLETNREHIQTDLFYRMFPSGVRYIADIASNVLAIAIYAILAWLTYQQAVKSTEVHEVSMGVNLLPIWPVRWILPVAFSMAAIASLAKLATDFRRTDT